jgi:uncharacterized membrane protein
MKQIASLYRIGKNIWGLGPEDRLETRQDQSAALIAVFETWLTANRTLGLITFMGRLAMADIFLVALYVVIAKGTGVGRLETAWGLYLFTACVLVSLALGQVTKRQNVAAI